MVNAEQIGIRPPLATSNCGTNNWWASKLFNCSAVDILFANASVGWCAPFPPVGFDHVLIVPSPFPSELMCPCAVQLAFFLFHSQDARAGAWSFLRGSHASIIGSVSIIGSISIICVTSRQYYW